MITVKGNNIHEIQIKLGIDHHFPLISISLTGDVLGNRYRVIGPEDTRIFDKPEAAGKFAMQLLMKHCKAIKRKNYTGLKCLKNPLRKRR